MSATDLAHDDDDDDDEFWKPNRRRACSTGCVHWYVHNYESRTFLSGPF